MFDVMGTHIIIWMKFELLCSWEYDNSFLGLYYFCCGIDMDTSIEYMSNYFHNSCGGNVVISADMYFVYNDESKLWKISNKDRIIFDMVKLLRSHYDHDSVIGKKLNSCTFPEKIWKHAEHLFVDNEFIRNLRNVSGVLPIRGGRVIDLHNGEIMDRKKEHYFTYELDVDYKQDTPLSDEFFSRMEDRDKVQAFLGYCLGGYGVYHVVFDGNNDHSDVITLLCSVLGNNTIRLKSVSEYDKVIKTKSHRESMVGKRVVVLDKITKDTKMHNSVTFVSTTLVPGTDKFGCFDISEITFRARVCDDAPIIERNRLTDGDKSDIFSWMVKGSIKYFKKDWCPW